MVDVDVATGPADHIRWDSLSCGRDRGMTKEIDDGADCQRPGAATGGSSLENEGLVREAFFGLIKAFTPQADVLFLKRSQPRWMKWELQDLLTVVCLSAAAQFLSVNVNPNLAIINFDSR